MNNKQLQQLKQLANTVLSAADSITGMIDMMSQDLPNKVKDMDEEQQKELLDKVAEFKARTADVKNKRDDLCQG